MSIANYGELKTAVATWLGRSDLASRIPEFIALSEASVKFGIADVRGNFIVQPLRIRAMEVSESVTIDAQTVDLPTGWLGARRFYLGSGSNREMHYLGPQDFWGSVESSLTGEPKFFTIEGETFAFSPAPGGTYTGKVLYYKGFDALAADADTNWLLKNCPNVYLFGALFEAFAFARDPLAMEYRSRLAGTVNALNHSDKTDRASGSIMTQRSEGVV